MPHATAPALSEPSSGNLEYRDTPGGLLRLRLHLEDDFAPRLSLTEEVERRRRLLERVGRTHDRGDGSGFDHRSERILRLGEEPRLDGEEGTPRGADYIDVAQENAVHLNGRDAAFGEPDHDEPAHRCQAPDALVEPLPTHGVEDGVDAEAVVLCTQRSHPITLGVENAVCPCSFGDMHLVGTCGDGDDLGAKPASDLHRRSANAPGSSMDGDALAAADPTPARKGEMGGVVIHHEAGGRFHAEPFRD